MTEAPARALPLPARLLPGLAAAGAGGLLTGGLAAWAYYSDRLHPLAHTFGMEVALVALLSARRPVVEAVARSVAALGVAVLAFYVGKKVMYGIDFPGMPYSLNPDEIVEWLVLAVVVGSLLGWAFSRIGRPGRSGAVATAAAVGLLVGDAVRRGWGYSLEAPVVAVVTVVCVALVLAVGVRSDRQLVAVLLWTVPMAALGLLLVSLPDLLEQVLLTGRL